MAKYTREEIREQTIQIIRSCVPELADVELTEDSVISTDMGMDSMNYILVICKLETAFGARIPDRLWNRLRTLGHVIDAIEKYSD